METPATDLHTIASTGWGYAERTRIGAWELRAAGGFTTRANSAWPLGDSGRALPETLAEVAQWYTARGLTPRVQCIVGSELDQRIAEFGHTQTDSGALRQAADLAPALAILTATADPARTAELSVELPEDFFTVYRRGLGQEHSAAVLTTADDADLRFATVRDAEGSLLAVGRVAVNTAAAGTTERWAGVAAIHTAERARRQGLARCVMRDLLATAADHGATRVYLEVDEANAPARALYESLGFGTAHRYHCRVLV